MKKCVLSALLAMALACGANADNNNNNSGQTHSVPDAGSTAAMLSLIQIQTEVAKSNKLSTVLI